MAYVTLAELKTYMGADRSDDDGLLQQAIARAQSIFESTPPLGTGRRFESVVKTRHYGAENCDGQNLYIWDDDLLTVTALTNGDGEVIPAEAYRLEPGDVNPKWLIRLLSAYGYEWAFTDADSRVTIEGTWGFCSTPPEVIRGAVMRLAAYLYRLKDSTDPDRTFQSDGVVIQSSRIPRDIYDVIVAYRRKVG